MRRSHTSRSLTVVLAAGLAILVSLMAPPATAAPGADGSSAGRTALPPRSVKHTEQYWSWFAPRNWIASSGAYGINVSSPNGALVLDYGFSSIVCSSATTLSGSVNSYFRQQRAQLRGSLTSQWRRVQLESSRIRQLPVSAYGANYFRQVLGFSGRAQGIGWRGEAVYDYSLATGPTYCFSRSQSRVAPQQGYRTSIRELRSIQGALAYFGPGVPGGTSDPDE